MKRRSSGISDQGLQSYLKSVSRLPVPSREEEVELFQRVEKGDEAAREEIISRNLRFVVKIALQYRDSGIPVSDLVQEGTIGLMHVVDKFDWRKGFRFSTYAAYYIRQEIQAAVHRQGGMIRLPIRKARLLSRVQEVIARCQENEGREPSVEEIAEKLDVDVEKVETVIGLRHHFTSMEAEIAEDGLRLGDCLPAAGPAPHERLGEQQTCAVVHHLFDYLTPRERDVVELRYGFRDGDSYSLRQASTVVGLSQEGVRRVEARALGKLRRPTIRQQVEGLLTA